jgi:hypothetical protein
MAQGIYKSNLTNTYTQKGLAGDDLWIKKDRDVSCPYRRKEALIWHQI